MKTAQSILLASLLLTFFISCNDPYKLTLSSPETLQLNQLLNLKVTEKNSKPIDSVRYYFDGVRLEGNEALKLANKKLGRHAVSATVFYGEKAKQLTNTIILLSDERPKIYDYEVINVYNHDKDAFTQGLEYHNGFLYESTGQRGKSSLRKVELTTGKVLQKIDLDQKYFGEGMTIFKDKIYMLTWQNNKGFVFDLNSFKLVKEFNYNQSKEGWGLSHTAKKLIKTDGTERIWFLDPETLVEEGFIEAYTHEEKVTKLNEVEYIDGKIYANRWQRNGIAIIDIKTGAVTGVANLSGLQGQAGQKGDDRVLNGIAYDSQGDRMFVTGKNWDKVFEIKLKEKQ